MHSRKKFRKNVSNLNLPYSNSSPYEVSECSLINQIKLMGLLNLELNQNLSEIERTKNGNRLH